VLVDVDVVVDVVVDVDVVLVAHAENESGHFMPFGPTE
jgi:hypothetical protein